MNAKDKQIAYQVAWKAAIELVAHGIVELSTEDVGAEVKETADILYAPLVKVLEDIEPLDTPTTRSTPASRGGGRSAPSSGRSGGSRSSGGADDRFEMTEEACPNDGCDGVLLHNTTDRGPEWQCSKVSRVKRGTKWVDVGTCDYMDWGANGTNR